MKINQSMLIVILRDSKGSICLITLDSVAETINEGIKPLIMCFSYRKVKVQWKCLPQTDSAGGVRKVFGSPPEIHIIKGLARHPESDRK